MYRHVYLQGGVGGGGGGGWVVGGGGGGGGGGWGVGGGGAWTIMFKSSPVIYLWLLSVPWVSILVALFLPFLFLSEDLFICDVYTNVWNWFGEWPDQGIVSNIYWRLQTCEKAHRPSATAVYELLKNVEQARYETVDVFVI